MLARSWSIVFCAALVGCEASDRTRGRDVISLHSIRGRVVGHAGAYVDGASLTLHAVEPDGEKYVAATRSSFDGSYTVQTSRVGPHRLVAAHAASADSASDIVVEPGIGTIERDFVLAPRATATIRGFLAAADGSRLSTSELARLFPSAVGHDVRRSSTGADGVVEYFPFVGGSRLVARQAHGGRTPGGDVEAIVDPTSGAFRIDVASDFDGRLALDFRGVEIASVPLSGDSRTVEMFVEVNDAFARVGSLELTSGDSATTLDRLVVLRADARIGAAAAIDDVEEFFDLEDPKLPARLVGVPRGEYLVVAMSGADSLAIATATVEGFETTRTTLAFAPACSASIEIAGEPGDRGSLLDSAQLRTLDGLPLPARFSLESDSTLRLDGAPAGSCALFLGSGFVVLDLVADDIVVSRLELEPLQSTELRVKLFDAWRWQLVAAVPAQMRVFADEVLVSDSRFDVAFDAEGWVVTELDLPPGRYRAEFEVEGYRRVEGEIEAGFTSIFASGDFDRFVDDPELRRHGRLDR